MKRATPRIPPSAFLLLASRVKGTSKKLVLSRSINHTGQPWSSSQVIFICGCPVFFAGTLTDRFKKTFFFFLNLWTHLTHFGPNAYCYFICSDFWGSPYTMICILGYYIMCPSLQDPCIFVAETPACLHMPTSGIQTSIIDSPTVWFYPWCHPCYLLLEILPRIVRIITQFPLSFTYCRHPTASNSCLLTLP